ncbi:hypothetical protein EDC01DRAFT_634306 [Geopyxis carbonaria]|nr:hypothetical protein EDC01DRAFT_634306 [Geopyxis carbonaria]
MSRSSKKPSECRNPTNQSHLPHVKACENGHYEGLWKIGKGLLVAPIGRAYQTVILLLAKAQPVFAADDGDELTNNLFTDIAPLLSLFGERVAQHFLATSMSRAENIMFAVGPLGIITAIVSAIRCSGPVGLKALIGRSREGRAVAEVELLSSTSADVVELWNGTGIVRVLGRADIMQLVYVVGGPEATENTENDGESGSLIQSQKSVIRNRKSSRASQIYDFEDAIRKGILVDVASRPAHRHNQDFRKSYISSIFNWVSPVTADTPIEISLAAYAQNTVETTDASSDHSVPNVSLNVCAQKTSDTELSVIACIGILLQLGVVIFGACGVFVSDWNGNFKKNGKSVERYAFPMLASGTLLLTVGMFLCAYIIDKNTTETRWTPAPEEGPSSGKLLKFAWLQRGGDVGDQRFSSYVIDPHDADEQPTSDLWELFTKRRSGNRSMMITSRRSETSNHKLRSLTVLATVISLVGYIAQFLGLRFLHYSVTLAQLVATVFMVALRAWARRNTVHRPRHEATAQRYELDFMAKRMMNCKTWSVVSRTFEASVSPECAAADVLEIRRRLGVLSQWHVPCEYIASDVQAQIEVAMHFFFSRPEILNKERDWQTYSKFEWKLLVEVEIKGESSRFEEITLTISRRKDERGNWERWHASKADISCVLGLWLTNFELHGQGSQSTDPDTSSPCLRIFGRNSDPNRFIYAHWIPRQQSTTTTLLGRADILERNLARFTVGMPTQTGISSHTDWLGVVSTTSIARSCGQLIFSEFMAALAGHAIGAIGGGQREIHETDGPRYSNQVIDALVRELTISPVGYEEAYLSVIQPLIQAQKLAIFDLTVAENCSSLPLPPTVESEPYTDGVMSLRKTFWHCYLVETAANIMEAANRWEEARSMYANLMLHNPDSEMIRQMKERQECRRYITLSETRPLENFSNEHCESVLSQSTTGNQNESSLVEAALAGDNEMVGIILQHLSTINYEIDAMDKDGRTPLIHAALSGHATVVLQLLRAGSNVNHRDVYGRTALSYASEQGYSHTVNRLLLAPAINTNYIDTSVLSNEATPSQYLKTLLWFHGYNVNSGISRDWSQLQWCIWISASKEAFRRSLNQKHPQGLGGKHIVDILHLVAVNWGLDEYWKLATVLKLNRGHIRETCIHEAVARGDEMNVAQRLLNQETIVSQGDNEHRVPLLHWAALNSQEGVVRMLLDRGANIEAKDRLGRAAIHIASLNSGEGIVRMLLDRGADIETEDEDGQTLLHWASYNTHERVARMLLDRGANIEAKDKLGIAAIHRASANSGEGVVRMLLDRGADIETEDEDGQTPLHWAALNPHEGVIQMLLDRGANIEAKDKLGIAAIHRASANSYSGERVVRILLDRGAYLEAADTPKCCLIKGPK